MRSAATDRKQLGSIEPHVPRAEVSGLTGLRFVAAFSVIIAHGPQFIIRLAGSDFGPTYWMAQMAGLGMGLFFVLSGFVIHYNYQKAVTEGGLNGLASFVWARFARLYPLFVFVVILEIIIGRTLFEFMAGKNNDFPEVIRALPYYLTFTHSWFYVPLGDNSLIYAVGTNAALSWSISTEWFFYLSYPLVALIVIRARRPLITIIAALAWSIAWIIFVTILAHKIPTIDDWATSHYGPIASLANGDQDSFVRWLMYFSPYIRIGEFILGCLAAQLYLQLRATNPGQRENRAGNALLALGIASAAVLIYLMYVPNGHLMFIRNLSRNFGLAPSVATIIFCAARYNNLFSRLLNSRPFIALGEASYSIYMIHFMIFVGLGNFLVDLLPSTAPNVVFIVGKFILILALILLISLGLHAFIEMPARQWLRGLWRDGLGERNRVLAYSILASPGVAAALILLITNFAATDSTASAVGIRVLSATYGSNCKARRGNATSALRKICDGKDKCNYIVDVGLLGDPASGCAKNFAVEYRCAPDDKLFTKDLPGEAGLKSHLQLSCTSELAAAPKGGTTAVNSISTDTAAVKQVGDATPASEARPPSSKAKAAMAPADARSAGEIRVLSATYGEACRAPKGNATSDVRMSCDGERKCRYRVDVNRLGDPSPTCAKGFTVIYQCVSDGSPVKVDVPAEAGLGTTVELSCQSDAKNDAPDSAKWTGVRVLSATYGGNCGARIGNSTDDVENACGAKASCDYTVDAIKLGDPAQGCAKSFFVKYQCGGESSPRTTALPGEAGLGSLIHLACP